jgi:hypothetical protein
MATITPTDGMTAMPQPSPLAGLALGVHQQRRHRQSPGRAEQRAEGGQDGGVDDQGRHDLAGREADGGGL